MTDILSSLAFLKKQRWIDLTHEVKPSIPYFSAFKPITEETLFTVDNDGFFAKEYNIVTQYGTHIDAPIHFANNTRSLEEISVEELAVPLIVIHKEAAVAENPDFVLTVADIIAFEEEYGQIPAESFVAFASGWSNRWQDTNTFYNKDDQGVAHTPGWSLEALQFLHEERHITAIGHETLDTDSGLDFAKNQGLVAELYWLSQNKYQVEVLTNLQAVPATGAIILIGVPKIKAAPGFNARVFAICP